jgi:hypothetical protein
MIGTGFLAKMVRWKTAALGGCNSPSRPKTNLSDPSKPSPGADQIEEQSPNHFMQREKIILLPPSHESLPSFHVQRELLPAFLDHLANSGIKTAEPPEPQGKLGPGAVAVVGVDIEEGTSLKRLQEVLDEFLKRRSLPESSQKS